MPDQSAPPTVVKSRGRRTPRALAPQPSRAYPARPWASACGPLGACAYIAGVGLPWTWDLPMIADFRGLKLPHNGAHDLDGVSGTREPHCEVVFHCPWPLWRVIAHACRTALLGP